MHGGSHLESAWRVWTGSGDSGGGGVGWGVRGSDAQGHVTEQPLLRAAVVAVSQGGHHLVLLRRHVQTLVAVHMQQSESLRRGGHRNSDM